ncbi:transcriptional regulator with XRE-family HTH domain [Mumia flava]|uniref:Transcriptional regulator with XRE-family HTH domain n=1 Tax=Mumia flava TaxID=1348852 RepID=A0A0B2BVE9_9ACTN|nr:XRE family transcriptional regulator [Mumia flava]PJJ58014.1 transcriptional regulator with XRE-family HTH domain [Mumia flava]
MEESDPVAAVAPRLRALRTEHELTLAELGSRTGISVSTLSRLESGARRPTLEQLLPLARTYEVSLDDLVGTATSADPRVEQRPFTRHGRTFVPLSRTLDGLQAYKQTIPARPGPMEDLDQATHDGYEWLYVLSGRLRLLLGTHDLVLGPGEAAEFDTRVPHAIANAGREPVELLSLFGPQGERMHVRARPKGR